MAEIKIRRALISVWDKTGIVDFARALHDEFGVEILSTGGTARALKEAGIPVTLVEEVTGFPEMMDGRVKTLHPRIHAAILADRDNPEHMRQLREQGIEPIDMVVVNLYPFEKTIARPGCTFEDAIEMIDIGGPCLLRAAAKNHRHVLVLSDPRDWSDVLTWLREDTLSDAGWAMARRDYATSVYHLTRTYDSTIMAFLAASNERPTYAKILELSRMSTMRYGENPHQPGEFFRLNEEDVFNCEVGRSETELSFNNLMDANAALGLCNELARSFPGRSIACFIKHTNACGVGIADNPVEAYRRAYLGDPNAAMGGILAVNFEITRNIAAVLMDTYARWGKPLKEANAPYAPGGFFIEVLLSPTFIDDSSVRLIRGEEPSGPQKDWGKRVRLLDVGDHIDQVPDPTELDFKRIAGGVLMQTRDLVGLNEEQWKVVTKRRPSEREMDDLRLAWLICKHTKSNAITICKDGMLIGNGAGQMSRVMSCRIATWAAKENGHAEELAGAVAASDAFFPFRDGPDILADAGVTALIQPGGSKRDEDTIKACDERGIAMIFTGTRHFKHQLPAISLTLKAKKP